MDFNTYSGRRSAAAIAAGLEVVNVLVEHEDFKRIYDSCLDIVPTMIALKMPAGVLIQAESGMGKTLLLKTVQKGLIEALGDLSSRPTCLSISLDSAVDTVKMAAAVMIALGYPMLPSRPVLTNMNIMVDKGLERVRPVALLIDEMQHICEGNRDITARNVTDWLKVRMDKFNLPVIGSGTLTLERLSVINPQFTSRASANFVLTPFAVGEEARQLLAAINQAVKAVSLEIITGPVGTVVITATKGNFRAIKRLLAYACMHTVDRGSKVVSLEDLNKAYIDATGFGPGRLNPFVRKGKPAA
jgi:uncharacterized protein YqgV (UPF0045/DUF77 family)